MITKEKILEHFEGKVVRKDLANAVKGNAIVPTYVLEYLLGQYCAVSDPEIIEAGILKVRDIIREHYVHRDEAELVKSRIRERGKFRIIDKVSVVLNDRQDVYEASFTNLGLRNIPLSDEWIQRYPRLLTEGVWSLIDVSYQAGDGVKPWVVESLKPIQLSDFDFNSFLQARSAFTTEEWTDLLIQTIGLNPEHFSERGKWIQLTRLIPFCERNFNLIELGPKGTGKSHIYSEFSPHGMLLSGGEVTVAKLFVNNASGKIGLVGFWDTVAFDEFAGKEKKPPKTLVDIMKNYMANKSFSRGRDTMSADASMVFVGNTRKSVPFMLKHADLFEALPDAFYDTAFLDRLHHYIPGWEVDIIRGEMFTQGYGFIVDYMAEVLRYLRSHDYGQKYRQYFTLDPSIATRDKTAIEKTFSGLMKILYPGGECSKEEMKALLEYAIEGRKRVKSQLIKMDETFDDQPVRFKYTDLESGETHFISTLEEIQYKEIAGGQPQEGADSENVNKEQPVLEKKSVPQSGAHVVIKDNQKGISYKGLFESYLRGAKEIHLFDPYLRLFYQIKNLHEFCIMIMEMTPVGEEVNLKVVTKHDDDLWEQEKIFRTLSDSLAGSSLSLEVTFDDSSSFHARSIETDTGWKITMDRGLDIFQPYFNKENAFHLGNTVQTERACKQTEITYIKVRDL